jgi:hypothetical protein
VGRRVIRPKTCYDESELKKYKVAKIKKFTKRVKVKALEGLGRTQKRNRMGVTKHFVQEKPENKQVKGQQNQIMWGLQPIYRQSKFIVGKNEKNMADKRDRK